MKVEFENYDGFMLRELAQQLISEKAGELFHAAIKEEDSPNLNKEKILELKAAFKKVTGIDKDNSVMLNRDKIIEAIKLLKSNNCKSFG